MENWTEALAIVLYALGMLMSSALMNAGIKHGELPDAPEAKKLFVLVIWPFIAFGVLFKIIFCKPIKA